MTKKIFYLEFSLILLIFVLPPIFAKNGATAQADFGRLNFFAAPTFCAAILLLAQKKLGLGFEAAGTEETAETEGAPQTNGEPKAKEAADKTQPRPKANEAAPKSFASQRSARLLRAALFSSSLLTCFGSLLLCGLLFWRLQCLFPNSAPSVVLPKSAAGWAACVFLLLASALFEEALYRWHLPAALLKIAETFCKSKKASANQSARKALSSAGRWICEIAALLLFALAHRWQGWISVSNALCCGIILRLCAVRAKSLAPGILAHFLYNACALFFAL